MEYITGKVIQTEPGDVLVTPAMAKAVTRYLIKNDHADVDDKITAGYHDAKTAGTIVPLPSELGDPVAEDGREIKRNYLNSNFRKAAFQRLWN